MAISAATGVAVKDLVDLDGDLLATYSDLLSEREDR